MVRTIYNVFKFLKIIEIYSRGGVLFQNGMQTVAKEPNYTKVYVGITSS